MKRFPLTITTEAVSHLGKILSAEKPILLIGVKGGGCNGMQYFAKAVSSHGKVDEVFVQNDVTLAVCGTSLLYLLGTHIRMKHDVMGSRVEFENPNAVSKCGCGETFNVDF